MIVVILIAVVGIGIGFGIIAFIRPMTFSRIVVAKVTQLILIISGQLCQDQ